MGKGQGMPASSPQARTGFPAPSAPHSLKPRFEEAFTKYPFTILSNMLDHLDYESMAILTQVSSAIRTTMSRGEAKEMILERYLGPETGYRSMPDPSSSSSQAPSDGLVSKVLQLSFRDLSGWRAGRHYSLSELAILAAEHKSRGIPLDVQRMIRASTRAHNRLVIRLRQQPSERQHDLKPQWREAEPYTQLYKPGRAATLRVWIPSHSQWMTDHELLECER